MSKLLFFLFLIGAFFISIFLLLILKIQYNRSSKINSFSPLRPITKLEAYNPDINTFNWDLHKKRLIKFRRSQYKGLTFFVSLEGRIYYLSEEGTKVYC